MGGPGPDGLFCPRGRFVSWIGNPQWHRIHHSLQPEHFDKNFAGLLPLWDILFGTFRNPREWNARCGLGAENEGRVIEMLLGVDVWKSKPQDSKRWLDQMVDSFIAYLASSPLHIL